MPEFSKVEVNPASTCSRWGPDRRAFGDVATRRWAVLPPTPCWSSIAMLLLKTTSLPPSGIPTMRRKVTLRKMGGSVGATIPKDIADRLHVQAGDEIFVVETEDGVLLTPYDPEFQKAMAAYERTAGKYRNGLRELAK